MEFVQVTEAVNAKKYGYEKWGHGSCICYHLSGLHGLVCVFCPLTVLETVYYAGRNRADYQRSAESVDCCHSNACSEGLQAAQRLLIQSLWKMKVTVMGQMEFKMERPGLTKAEIIWKGKQRKLPLPIIIYLLSMQ